MSKAANLTFGTILLAMSLYGQEITKEQIRKFRIKSIVTFDDFWGIESTKYYDSDGNIVRAIDKKAGKILRTTEFFYDSAGLLTTEKLIVPSGKVKDVRKYVYDDHRRLIKEESYESDFSVAGVWTSEYDSLGNMVKYTQKTKVLAGNGVTYLKYVGTRLVEEIEGDSKDPERTYYKYNNEGQLLEVKTIGADCILTDEYIYDDSGKVIQMNVMTTIGESGRWIFEYNSQGILQRDVWESLAGKDKNCITYTVVTEN